MSLTFNDYRQLDALGLADAIRRGAVSRREVMDAAMAQMQALHSVLAPIVRIRKEELA